MRHHNGFFALFALFLLATTACGQSGAKSASEAHAADTPDTSTQRAVEVEPVRRADMLYTRDYVADLQPAKYVTVIALATERILEMPWEDGDHIQEGEVIARIRQDSFRRSLDQIRAELAALDTQIASQEREVQRTKKLLEGNAATRQALDQLQASLDATVARRRGLEASRAQINLSLEHTVVKSPIAGVVTNKRVEVGDIASPQVPLMVIMELDPIKIVLDIAERDIAAVRPDQELVLRVDAYPGEVFTARISKIMPFLQADTRTNTVEAIVTNPTDPETGLYRLKPGMYGRVELVLDRRQQVLSAPDRALLLEDDLLSQQNDGKRLRRVYVLGLDNTAEARVVEVGPSTGGRTEVISGLREDDQLIVRGHHGLKDGQKVRLPAQGKPVPEAGQETATPPPLETSPAASTSATQAEEVPAATSGDPTAPVESAATTDEAPAPAPQEAASANP